MNLLKLKQTTKAETERERDKVDTTKDQKLNYNMSHTRINLLPITDSNTACISVFLL